MTTTSPSSLLGRHAPEPTIDLDHLMPNADLDGLLESLGVGTVVPARTRRRRLRRWSALGAAAAVLAVAVLVGQSILSQPQPAAAIARLAETAGEQPVPVIPEGKYLRTVFVDNPDGIEGWPQDYPRELDTWISSDGTKTIYETMGVQQNRASWRVLPWEQLAGVREVEQMPTDPNALFRVVLPDGVDESDPFAEEYAFDHFLDIVRYGYAPPGVNQAAITAMGLLSSVHVEPSVSYLGEPCLRVTRTEVNRDSEESYGCFQESTGHLLEWGSDYPGSAPFISVLMSRELLDEGPTEPVDPPRLNN